MHSFSRIVSDADSSCNLTFKAVAFPVKTPLTALQEISYAFYFMLERIYK